MFLQFINSCTHIPFSHTCATWAPLQVLAIYSASEGIRARTYPFHTLVPLGLLSRSWRYTQQPKAFVHAHTLFTHLCHVGSSPGPGDILSSQRHSCTHIPFPHTCATRAPLQVLASMASVGRTPLHKATSICSNTSGDDFKHRSTSGGRRKFNRSSTLVKSGDKQPGGISAEDAALRNALSPEFQYVFNLTVFTLCVFFEGGHFHF